MSSIHEVVEDKNATNRKKQKWVSARINGWMSQPGFRALFMEHCKLSESDVVAIECTTSCSPVLDDGPLDDCEMFVRRYQAGNLNSVVQANPSSYVMPPQRPTSFVAPVATAEEPDDSPKLVMDAQQGVVGVAEGGLGASLKSGEIILPSDRKRRKDTCRRTLPDKGEFDGLFRRFKALPKEFGFMSKFMELLKLGVHIYYKLNAGSHVPNKRWPRLGNITTYECIENALTYFETRSREAIAVGMPAVFTGYRKVRRDDLLKEGEWVMVLRMVGTRNYVVESIPHMQIIDTLEPDEIRGMLEDETKQAIINLKKMGRPIPAGGSAFGGDVGETVVSDSGPDEEQEDVQQVAPNAEITTDATAIPWEILKRLATNVDEQGDDDSEALLVQLSKELDTGPDNYDTWMELAQALHSLSKPVDDPEAPSNIKHLSLEGMALAIGERHCTDEYDTDDLGTYLTDVMSSTIDLGGYETWLDALSDYKAKKREIPVLADKFIAVMEEEHEEVSEAPTITSSQIQKLKARLDNIKREVAELESLLSDIEE